MPRPSLGTPLDDLIVVVPGILGSRLARRLQDGGIEEVWGTGFGSLVKNLGTFGSRVKDLAIPEGADPAAPGDGILATGLISDVAVLPNFNAITGYDGLIGRLRSRIAQRHDQVIGFPYDWRLSNRTSGAALARFLEAEVIAWRQRSGKQSAKAILIAHSMGGLVARWCIECEDGHLWASRLITIGTPFKGAAKALEALASGVRFPPWVGPRFDDLVHSLPSVRELLPTYACVRTPGRRELATVLEADVLPRKWVEEGIGFHDDLAKAVANREPNRTDDLIPFRGGLQPTPTTALKHSDGTLVMVDTTDATENGRDQRGDGTVPRDSATPPEWTTGLLALAKSVSQRHASMQVADSVFTELETILTDAPGRLAVRGELALSAPSTIRAGTPFDVFAEAPKGSALVASVAAVEDPHRAVTKTMKLADERWRARMPALEDGFYQISISAPPGAGTTVDPLTDYLVAVRDDWMTAWRE